MTTAQFRKTIWKYYRENGRDLPWRHTTDPYAIVVSEIMLQQTQVGTVLKKYPLFLKRFPTFRALANAKNRDVLHAWQGLGYNRRALSLQRLAQCIVNDWKEKLPNDTEILRTLPGIGKATAGSILAFAFNAPTIFIETNIRRVFIHHFFKNKEGVTDKEILPLVKKTLERKRARQWYWALMDYGTYLAKTEGNANLRSRHYKKQSPFKGSDREIRGKILKLLLENSTATIHDIATRLSSKTTALQPILDDLTRDGMIKKKRNLYRL